MLKWYQFAKGVKVLKGFKGFKGLTGVKQVSLTFRTLLKHAHVFALHFLNFCMFLRVKDVLTSSGRSLASIWCYPDLKRIDRRVLRNWGKPVLKQTIVTSISG